MADTFDLEELVHLEQTCYDAGYTDGFAHGRIHGLIEGRALGREKGFEIWDEIGYYEGFAETWQAMVALRGRDDARALHHIAHLLDLIRQFPIVNPSPQADTHPPTSDDPDLPKLQRQIRSRYRALCASLGVRPTLRAGADDQPAQPVDQQNQGHKRTTRPDVWTLTQMRDRDGGRPATTEQGLSF